jgi:putative addiction module CopG family antidote
MTNFGIGTPELGKFVEALVKSGRHASSSEVVRNGLRLLQQQEAALDTFRIAPEGRGKQ